MSWIFINSGQCGNQVGHEIIGDLWNHLENSNEIDLFFNSTSKGKKFAKCVNVDTEEKVIQSCYARSHNLPWTYHEKSMVHRYGGAGNNWALGYSMCSETFLEDIIEAVRWQLEKCNFPPSFLISHSVGGGTGSGLGTKLTEVLSDLFPEILRVNFAIAPYHFGEVIVQHYNSMLCLSKISSTSDAVLLYENEKAHELCIKQKGVSTPSLFEINSTLASLIVPLLLSKYQLKDLSNPHGKKNNSKNECLNAPVWDSSASVSFSEDVIRLCGHPSYKYLSVHCSPQTSKKSVDFTFDSWYAIINDIGRQLVSAKGGLNDLGQKVSPVKSIGASLTLRGLDPEVAVADINKRVASTSNTPVSAHRSAPIANVNDINSVMNRFVQFPNWVQDKSPTLYGSHHLFNGYQRSGVLLSNSNICTSVLDRSKRKAYDLYQSKSYLHHYLTYGVGQDDFINSFQSVHQIVMDYDSL